MSVKKSWPSGQAEYLTPDGRRKGVEHKPLPPAYEAMLGTPKRIANQVSADKGTWANIDAYRRRK